MTSTVQVDARGAALQLAERVRDAVTALRAVEEAAMTLDEAVGEDGTLESFDSVGFDRAAHMFSTVHFGADGSCFSDLSVVERDADELVSLVQWSKARHSDAS